MARKQYNVDEVLRALSQKNDVNINNRDIMVLSDKIYNHETDKTEPNPHKRNDLGNGSWGKIDFLVNYHGYRQVFVNKH